MKNFLAKLVLVIWKSTFSLILKRSSLQKKTLRFLSNNEIHSRLAAKKQREEPVNVLFVCHEPCLWSMFESIYQAMLNDPQFSPLIITLPYKHASDSAVSLRDGGMGAFLDERGIPHTVGYDTVSGKWKRIETFCPDYVFFQTPYGLFSKKWSIDHVSLIARVCYLPYGTTLFGGEVENIVHPVSFFKHVSLICKESEFTEKQFVAKFEKCDWFRESRLRVTGLPKLDRLFGEVAVTGKIWPRGVSAAIRRILWTPRWTTSEGACHFFDYKAFFSEFCTSHKGVDFAFRPHPLCLKNFISNKEMTETALSQMREYYTASSNMVIDEGGDYIDTFLSCDVLVSDLSSMMLEFLGTGKPIVYTHRVDLFNDLGRELSKGVYWVCDEVELKETLDMLLRGDDPLYQIRQGLIESTLCLPEGGAGLSVKEAIREEFSVSV